MKSKSYFRKVFFISALFFPLVNSSYGAVDSTYFNCTFPITEGEQSLRQFTLTPDVFNCMEFNNYDDLTIINGDGKIVPFNISVTKATTQRIYYEEKLSVYAEPAPSTYKTGDQIKRIARLTGANADNESQIEWQEKNKFYSSVIVEQASGNENLDSIVINISPSNSAISAMLVVEASNDLQQWVTLLSPYHLLILPGDAKTLSNNKLPLNSYHDFKYLRIAALSNRENFTQQISSIYGSYEKAQQRQSPLQWLEVSIATTTAKENEWLLEVPTLIPVSQIRLSAINNMVVHQGSLFVATHKNPSSAVNHEATRFQGKEKVKALLKRTIKGRPNQTTDAFQWQFITSFIDYRLQTDNGVIVNAPFEISTTQSHLWKIVFDHPEVSSSEQLPKIELGWRPPEIVFVAQGNGPFQLLVGNNKRVESVRVPSALNGLHNAAEVVGLLDATQITPQTNENAQPHSPETTQNNYAIWFWLILLAGLLIMVVMAYRLNQSLSKAADTKTPNAK